jgi:cellulose synthase/poly-beta-1,6-N-acetylglucosamine synthase-like glycosyltransferase
VTVLTLILGLFIAFGTLVYLGFLVFLSFGLFRLRRGQALVTPSISVVIPMHDEEVGVGPTLQALAAQDYPGEWELICVDDRSRDRTAEIVRAFQETHPRVRLVQVGLDEPDIPSPKKRALARGMDAAQYEILATTDADCLPPAHWLSTLASHFQPGVDVVQGPKHILGDGRLSHRYQRLEVLSFVAAEAAGFALNRPFLASAPSLAYRREIYKKCGGFHGLEGLISGDDDMLVHRMVHAGAQCTYAFDPSASVATHPADTWREVLNQRARWASNGSRYENPVYVGFLATIFFWWCWLLVGWAPSLSAAIPSYFWTLPWAVKFPADLLFLGLAAYRFRRMACLLDYLWAFPLQVAIAVRSAIAGHLGWFRWTREADGG